MKNIINTPNILIINHRFEETDLKYFKISEWAASTFNCVSSTFASILKKDRYLSTVNFAYVSKTVFYSRPDGMLQKLFGIVGFTFKNLKKKNHFHKTRLVNVFMMFTQHAWNFLY